MKQATELLAALSAALAAQGASFRMAGQIGSPLEESPAPRDDEPSVIFDGELTDVLRTLALLCSKRGARLVQCSHVRVDAYRCVVAFDGKSGRPSFTALHIRAHRKSRSLIDEAARLWRRWWNPRGMLIAIVGPDGCGKSSVAHAVDRRVYCAFRQTAIVHLRPGFLYPPERLSTRAHVTRPRNTVQSLLRLIPFAADYCVGYLASLRLQMVREDGLLFDGYYDDLLVDPAHYQYGGPIKVARVLRALVPRPDLWIVLDASTATLRLRKQRLSRDELERQRASYRAVLSAERHVRRIDASKPLQRVIADTADVILQHCEARIFALLGLPAPAQAIEVQLQKPLPHGQFDSDETLDSRAKEFDYYPTSPASAAGRGQIDAARAERLEP